MQFRLGLFSRFSLNFSLRREVAREGIRKLRQGSSVYTLSYRNGVLRKFHGSRISPTTHIIPQRSCSVNISSCWHRQIKHPDLKKVGRYRFQAENLDSMYPYLYLYLCIIHTHIMLLLHFFRPEVLAINMRKRRRYHSAGFLEQLRFPAIRKGVA